jgi:hypothetical protein
LRSSPSPISSVLGGIGLVEGGHGETQVADARWNRIGGNGRRISGNIGKV